MNVQTGVIIISVVLFSSSSEGATVKVDDGAYTNGPSVKNSAAYGPCSGTSGTLEWATEQCDKEMSCKWLHDWGCDDKSWRFCSKGDISDHKGKGGCSKIKPVKEDTCGSYPTDQEHCSAVTEDMCKNVPGLNQTCRVTCRSPMCNDPVNCESMGIVKGMGSEICKLEAIKNYCPIGCATLCKTVGGEIPENCTFSPQQDKPCVFPFKYKGSMYNECIFDDHEVAWCATEVNMDKTIVQDQWGHCAVGCPGSLDNPPRSSETNCTNKGGLNCHFPFTHLGKIWNNCTDKNDGYDPWCPYNVKQESKEKYPSGNCPGGEEVFEVVQGGEHYWGYCKQSKECSGACRCRKDEDYVNPCSANWNAGMTCQVEFPTDCPDIMCDFRCEDPRARRYSKTACGLTYFGKNAP